MRASRLLSILTTLQAKGGATAQALAAEAEVSVRTIYRDVEALSEAGVPIYAERGPEGGYRLLDGYRTRLNGLSASEADAMFLAGLPGPAATLGLAGAAAAAELKLLAALPGELRERAGSMRGRFHFDAADWFVDLEAPPALAAVAEAVRSQARLSIEYQARQRTTGRTLDPLGIVLKSGTWYLVARSESRSGKGIATYRVSRIARCELLPETFAAPRDFDLAAYWQASAEAFEAGMFNGYATVRLSPWAMQRLIAIGPIRAKATRESAGPPDAAGWRTVQFPYEWPQEGVMALLRFGAEAELLGPPDLREMMADLIDRLAGIYARANHLSQRETEGPAAGAAARDVGR